LTCSPTEDELAAPPALGDLCVHAVERTSGLACFLLAGQNAVEVMNRITSLDVRDVRFPDLSCARTPLAHVNAWMARP